MDSRKLLIIGSKGQLGSELQKILPEGTFVDREEFDITDPARFQSEDWTKYSTIINVAAYTAVDAAETAEGRLAAWLINASAVGYMADIANKFDLTLLHISSDYVFDGQNKIHTEDEPFSPLGVYGQTKAAGDIAAKRARNHYIIRTSWVVGEGKNFVRTMVELAKKGVKPKVVGDQLGRLTFTKDIANFIVFLLQKNAPYGTYNMSNGGDIASWAEIAKAVFEAAGSDANHVSAITTEEYSADKPSGSPRPLNSALDLKKITELGYEPRDWRIALKEYIKESR